MTDSKTGSGHAASVTPHDLVFKQFLTHPATARDFMELHLPPALRALCDFRTLRLESGSFVEEQLRPYFSDVLYSLKTRNGASGYIHVLIEHQSTPDRHMAFRLMRYAVAAMKRHLDAGHKTLPLVIPVLFYTGKRSPYPWSTRWLDGFDTPDLAEQLYCGDFPLVDITVISDDEIMGHRSMAALTLLQKHIHRRDLMALLDRLATVLLKEFTTEQQLASLINYLVQVGETTNAKTFVHTLAQRVPQHGGTLMTIAQQLEQEGIDIGKRTALLNVARAMLDSGFDHEVVMAMTGLTADDIAQLLC
ncbi:Rpn family recombination-promoting nuclease/putative transposase [Shimwellia pseudoproteus]|uniref:Rpn family recombination-promoting nuclease/putative transposase n=1 Tax=Shimwellia pseudoproteus TaxID=570012 RepID=UPI0018EDADAB|nr:Rpn family recombination-promoting nuclease/putative transposase [Shimwellia pseudoproteus]MBJ3815321.1 Rpn family recombination-promoting nuclease/putative transposase [Shimwellia pseudoproteus]